MKNIRKRFLIALALTLGLSGFIATPVGGQTVERSRTWYRSTTNTVSLVIAGVQRALIDLNGLSVAASATTGEIFRAGATAATPDLALARDAANTLAQRSGTAGQTFRVYNTYTDASNYEFGFSRWNSNVFEVGTTFLGTGSVRPLRFLTGNSPRWEVSAAGHFLAVTDNSFDIGASGATRPRNYFGAGYVQTGAVAVASLPTCNAAAKGARHFVTDANAATFLTAAAGGGANNVPVVCDGTSWKIG